MSATGDQGSPSKSVEVEPSNAPLFLIIVFTILLGIFIFLVPWELLTPYLSYIFSALHALIVAVYLTSFYMIFIRDGPAINEFEPRSPLRLIDISIFGPVGAIVTEYLQVAFFVHISYLLFNGIVFNKWNHQLNLRNYLIISTITLFFLAIPLASVIVRVGFMRQNWNNTSRGR